MSQVSVTRRTQAVPPITGITLRCYETPSDRIVFRLPPERALKYEIETFSDAEIITTGPALLELANAIIEMVNTYERT